jgi:glycosyltransferase involved in cell wall biosynthesis
MASLKPSSHPKVLFLPRWYPNRYDPMPGLFIRRHALSVSRFYKVAVLYVHLDPEIEARTYEIEHSDEQDIFEVLVYYKASKVDFKTLASLINLYRFFIGHLEGYQIIRKKFGTPDLLHVNVLTRLGLIALIYRLFTKVPYIVTEHWTRYLPGMNSFKGWFRKILTKIVVRNAAAIMPVTLNLQQAMQKYGLHNSNYQVIPNVVDTELFTPKDYTENKTRKMFLHVSCFDDKQKNISGILRVLKTLSVKRQDWICTMVGEGIHFDQLVKYADQLHLKDSFVFFTGLKENKELVALMQQASFQVIFSRYENLPVVITESFACGVPFLSTDVGGIAEHIHKNLGLLVKSEDEDALLAGLEYMLDDQEKFDKATIRQYAVDHFSNEVIGKQIRAVYEHTLNRTSI